MFHLSSFKMTFFWILNYLNFLVIPSALWFCIKSRCQQFQFVYDCMTHSLSCVSESGKVQFQTHLLDHLALKEENKHFRHISTTCSNSKHTNKLKD